MASKLSPSTPRSKTHRGSGMEIERTPLAGKSALSMFGENSPKLLKRTPIGRGAELSQVQEELAKTKEQLALMEKSKSNLLQDLSRSKRQVDELAAKLQDVTKVSEKDRILAEEMEQASFTGAEDWQVELEAVKQQYEAAVMELEANRAEMDSLKHELIMSKEAKNEAVRLAGEAMNAAETTAKRVEELSAEIIAARRALVIGKESPTLKTDDMKREVHDCDGNLVSCCEGAQDTALFLAEKETELEAALQETNLVRAELESLKGELALAQASCSENAQGSALLLMAKESELDDALQESKQARTELEALRQDLVLAKAACEETLHGNRILLAAKDIELDKALQDASDARAELEGVKQQLALSQELQVEHMALSSTFEQLQKDLASSEESKVRFERELSHLTLNFDKLTHDLADTRENERRLTYEMHVANEQAKLELTSTKIAKEEALVSASNARAAYERCNAELVRVRECESATITSMSKLSFELEEMQGKLWRTSLEETLLVSLLDALKVDLEKTNEQLESLQMKEMTANSNLQILSLELTNVTRAHSEEKTLLKSRIRNSEASLEAFRIKYESQKLDLTSLAEKESAARTSIEVLNLNLEQALIETIELKERLSNASERGVALDMELKNTQNELTELKEKELCLTYNVGSLIDDLEARKLEVSDLNKRVAVAEEHVSTLTTNLEDSQSELARLKKRELAMNSKATALSVALASLSESNEIRLLELRQQEELADIKAAALHDELRRMALEFENALTAAKSAKEEVAVLQKSLQITSSDRELAWQEVQVARDQAIRENEIWAGALKEAEAAQYELQKALQEAQAAEQTANEGLQQAKMLEKRLQMAEENAFQEKIEADKVRELLQGAQMDSNKLCKELDQERQESSSLKQEICGLRAELFALKEHAIAVCEENKAANRDIENLRKEVECAKSAEEIAESMSKSAEVRLQNALLELKSGRSHASAQDEVKHQPCIASNAPLSDDLLQEEFNKLKLRFEDTETRLATATKELQASITMTERLSMELEAIKLVKESNEKAVVEVHQLLTDTEKAKMNMEAEIQRLLDCSKQWQGAKDAIDIPIHPEMSGHISFDCRDEKPFPDNLEELPTYAAQTEERIEKVGMNGTMKWEDSATMSDGLGSKQEQTFPSGRRLDSPDCNEGSLRDDPALQDQSSSITMKKKNKNLLGDSPDCDEGSVRDDGALQDESSPIPMRKKKKNLLGRLGTLLDKKKHSQQQSFS